MTAAQHLFVPAEPDDPELSIQERFERFHARNPWVYAQLVILARQARTRRPRRRLGIKHLIEVLRWQYESRTTGDDWKMNNNYSSRYARLIMDTEADLADAFEIRELHTP